MKFPSSIIAVALFFAVSIQLGCGSTRQVSDTTERSIVVKQLVKTTNSWNGDVLPAYPEGQPEITVLRISIPAGALLATHLHPVINAGVLISGVLTVVTVDGDTLELKAGDPIVEVVNILHYGINHGDVPAEIIVFYAGVVDSPVTVAESN